MCETRRADESSRGALPFQRLLAGVLAGNVAGAFLLRLAEPKVHQ